MLDPDSYDDKVGTMTEEDSADIRGIAAELAAVPTETRRFVSGFAYVLARVARTDAGFSDAERASMERAIIEIGQLSEAQAALVVEATRSMGLLYGATEDYVITREFARVATREQCEALLRTGFSVSAADDHVSGSELAELSEIGAELGFTPEEVEAIRGELLARLEANASNDATT